MSDTITPTGPTILMDNYCAVIERLEEASGKQLTNLNDLCNFAKDVKEGCGTDKHLQDFSKRANDVKNDIFRRAREAGNLTFLQIRNESTYEYLGDKDRWIEEHGSIIGWSDYMSEIGYTRYHEAMHDHWTKRVRGVQDMEKLWGDLCMADAKLEREELRQTEAVAPSAATFDVVAMPP